MTRRAALCAVALFAVAAPASAQVGGFRPRFNVAPTNNNSDNGGVGGGSTVAGCIFCALQTGVNTPNATAGAPPGTGNAGAPNAAGISVTTSGSSGGGITTSAAVVVAGLATGTVTVTTGNGGTITVTVPPAVGAAVAAAITNPSPANGLAAGNAIAQTLTASNVPPAIVLAVSNAVQAIGTSADLGASLTALSAASTAIRAAAGTLTASEAQSLTAALLVLRAAVQSR